jgi:ribokinase
MWDAQNPSGTALIMVNGKLGENLIAVAPGANAQLSPQDIQAAESAIREADCVLMQLEIPLETVKSAIALAEKYQVRVILNPAPATKLPVELLDKVDTLTPNETEAVELSEHSARDAADAAYILRSRLKTKNLVITMGGKGAMIVGFRHEIIPAFNVSSVDATGAGDSFNGALAVALARGDNLKDAVKFANAVAALSTTRQGAQSAMPSNAEVETFLHKTDGHNQI